MGLRCRLRVSWLEIVAAGRLVQLYGAEKRNLGAEVLLMALWLSGSLCICKTRVLQTLAACRDSQMFVSYHGQAAGLGCQAGNG